MFLQFIQPGAYESDTAIFLKSRPIINVLHAFSINPQNISLENNRCKDNNGKDLQCLIQIEFCLAYEGGRRISDRLTFVYNITLDVHHDSSPRLSFKGENPSKTLDLEKNKGHRCHRYQTIISVSLKMNLKKN